MDKKLAERCADYAVMVALRDDVVSRFSPQALERLQKELRDLDLDAAKQVLVFCTAMSLSFLPCKCSQDNMAMTCFMLWQRYLQM